MTTKKIVSVAFLILFSVCILIAGIYFLGYQSTSLSKEKAQELAAQNFVAKKASYIINNSGDARNYEITVEASTTVFSILESLGQEEKFTITYKVYPEMGVLIQGINGVVNGTENKYWQYWVNDILGEVACDNKFLKAGDKVEWKFDTVPTF